MGEWKEYKLGELGNIVTGKTPSSKFPEEFGSAMPFVTPTDYKNYNKWISCADRHLSEKGIAKLKGKVLPENTLLVTCIGSDMGKTAMNKIPVITNQQINSIVTNEKVDPNFLYYKLVESYDLLRTYGDAGTAVPIVNKGDFENIEIAILESKTEQIQIASILSSLDDKIDLLHRQNKTLEALAETLFRRWFPPASACLHRQAGQAGVEPACPVGREAEEGWETGKLGEYVQFLKGKKPNNAFEDYLDGLMPQILIETFDTGKTLFSEPQNMVIANEKDILMVMDGASSGRAEIGFTGIVGSTIGLFKPVSSFNYPFFIFYLLKASESNIREHTTGSAIPHADKALILDLDIQYSSIERIIEFEKMAEVWFKKKKANRKQIRTLTRLRDTLLPKLMSGEVGVEYENN